MRADTKRGSIGLTILLAVGLITVIFPLYMTIVIAFKNSSDMTNIIGSLLALPKHWEFQNFAEAIRTTDFFHTLGNSLLITAGAVIGVILLNSIAAYAIGRNIGKSRYFKFIYGYFICGMFVPFSMLMLPLVKEVSILGLDNRFGLILLYIVFNMPMNTLLYTGYLKNIPLALEEAGLFHEACKNSLVIFNLPISSQFYKKAQSIPFIILHVIFFCYNVCISIETVDSAEDIFFC